MAKGVRVGINGFGRIGRLVFRALVEQGLLGKELDVVAVNDLVPADNLAYLLKYDSTQGGFKGQASSKKSAPDKAEDDVLVVDGQRHQGRRRQDARRAAVEGARRRARDRVHRPVHRGGQGQGPHHRRREEGHHLRARRRTRTSPSSWASTTTSTTRRSTTSSRTRRCTTNCLAPVVHVLLKEGFGIDEGLMTTIHSYTATQKTVDGPSQEGLEGRRARGDQHHPVDAPARRRPSGWCCPEVKGKLDRHVVPRADADRLGRRPDREDRRRRPATRRSARAMKKASETVPEGHPRLHRGRGASRATSSTTRARRSSTRQRHRAEQQLLQARRLVRQRVGLLEPLRRPRAHRRRRSCERLRPGCRRSRTLALAGKRVVHPRRLQRAARRGGAVADDTRIRESAADDRARAQQGRARDPRARTSDGRRRRPTRSTRSSRSRRGASAARRHEVCADDCVGDAVEARGREAPRRRGAPAREPALPRRRGGERRGFARSSRGSADVYVNDAFGTAHRAHASTDGHRAAACRRAAAGFLMQREVEVLGALLGEPERPFVAHPRRRQGLGQDRGAREPARGASTPSLIGGAMANTFLQRAGRAGRQDRCVEEDKLALRAASARRGEAQRRAAAARSITSWRRASTTRAGARTRRARFPDGAMALDIGPRTRAAIVRRAIAAAQDRVLERPDGRVREAAPFAAGTRAVAEALATRARRCTVVGGGDSVGGGQAAGVGDAHQPRLDGRRRVARVPRGQGAARRRGAARRPR